MHTEGRMLQDIPNTDMQIFIDPYHIWQSGGAGTLTRDAAGVFELAIAASQACVFNCFITPLLRTGMYADQYTQEQFGTAAAVAGPSAVPNTSGPLALAQGIPPLTTSQLATVGNVLRGPMPKGIRIDSIDVIYAVGAVNLTSMTIGINKAVFVDGVAPAVTALLAQAQNGLSLAFQAQPHVINVPVAGATFTTDKDALVSVEVDLTTPVGGTAKFYGIVVHCSYNFN